MQMSSPLRTLAGYFRLNYKEKMLALNILQQHPWKVRLNPSALFSNLQVFKYTFLSPLSLLTILSPPAPSLSPPIYCSHYSLNEMASVSFAIAASIVTAIAVSFLWHSCRRFWLTITKVLPHQMFLQCLLPSTRTLPRPQNLGCNEAILLRVHDQWQPAP